MPKITMEQARVLRRCLPFGALQRRILRGEEDAALTEIDEALTMHLEDRRELRGGATPHLDGATPHLDDSLIETIALCRERCRHLDQHCATLRGDCGWCLKLIGEQQGEADDR